MKHCRLCSCPAGLTTSPSGLCYVNAHLCEHVHFHMPELMDGPPRLHFSANSSNDSWLTALVGKSSAKDSP